MSNPSLSSLTRLTRSCAHTSRALLLWLCLSLLWVNAWVPLHRVAHGVEHGHAAITVHAELDDLLGHSAGSEACELALAIQDAANAPPAANSPPPGIAIASGCIAGIAMPGVRAGVALPSARGPPTVTFS